MVYSEWLLKYSQGPEFSERVTAIGIFRMHSTPGELTLECEFQTFDASELPS